MSMWEVEHIIEQTIKLIASADSTDREKRHLIHNAYYLQAAFDTSHTHFRVKDILLSTQYMQAYAIEEFPTYHLYPKYFDSLIDAGDAWVYDNPTAIRSADNPEVALWDNESQRLYVDFGSPYYSLNTDETVALYEPLDFALLIIREASKQNNKGIVYDWTGFVLFYLLTMLPSDKTVSELQQPYFTEIRSIFASFDFTNYEPIDDRLDLYSDFHKEWLSEQQLKWLMYVTAV
ncbi:MAG: hypothetical protein ACTH7W_01950 [Psychrobacter sp.]|uniref:hypothetical protein n=1 Tax=unclassified Psychrobacter TaxID=196806 RepID=UPI0017885DB6|nr:MULTISPECIES: hypothetical protein [unclassified Psychrobacter]MBE0441781.1 hypothetical protein [Psychrobacter sp. FME13]